MPSPMTDLNKDGKIDADDYAIADFAAGYKPPATVPAIPVPPPVPGGLALLTVKTQAELDAAFRQKLTNTIILVQKGTYTIAAPYRPGDGVVVCSPKGERAVLKWTGAPDSKGGSSLFALGATGARVENLHLDCGGTSAFNITGRDSVVANVMAVNVAFFCRGLAARNTFVHRCDVPLARYFWYSGGLHRLIGGAGGKKVVTDPTDGVTLSNNKCGGSTGEHIFRFHDTQNVKVIGNDFARPNTTEQKTIGKVHDGRNIEIARNKLSGGRQKYSGVLTFGPLAGKDGGILDAAGPERERKLALKLVDVSVHDNQCDDVVFHVALGVENLRIENNRLAHVRDVPFYYRATENGQDYARWRKPAAGIIKGNTVTLAPGIKLSATSNMPATMQVT